MKGTKLERCVLPRLEEIKKWAGAGVKQADIAKNLGVALSTFREYKKSCPALSAALEEAVAPTIKTVESALYDNCRPHTTRELTNVFRIVDGEMKLIESREKIVEHMGDVAAQRFFLSNKSPDEWTRAAEKMARDITDNFGVLILPEATDGEDVGIAADEQK